MSLHKTSMEYEVSVHAIKNTRRKMEDRNVIITDFNRLFDFPKVTSVIPYSRVIEFDFDRL